MNNKEIIRQYLQNELDTTWAILMSGNKSALENTKLRAKITEQVQILEVLKGLGA